MASFKKLLLLGGAGAAAAALLLKRDKVAALLPGGSSAGEPAPSWTPAPAAGPSNYDAPGPVANTATPVPAPEPEVVSETGAIDEAAEEAAAAAEAANIGGAVADYADDDEPSLAADEAERPLMEAGEGYAEGEEQAEAELITAAEPDPAPGISDYQRQIDDTIEEAGIPSAGEQVEPASTPDFDTRAQAEADAGETEPLFAPPETPGVPDTSASEPPTEAETAPGLPDAAAAEAAEAAAADAPTTEWQPPAPPEEAPAAEAEESGAYETFIAMPAVTPEPAPEAEAEAEAEEAPPAAEPEPASEPEAEEPPAEERELPKEDEPGDGGSDWRTWSGRSINP